MSYYIARFIGIDEGKVWAGMWSAIICGVVFGGGLFLEHYWWAVRVLVAWADAAVGIGNVVFVAAGIAVLAIACPLIDRSHRFGGE
jgi:hypothetical protein